MSSLQVFQCPECDDSVAFNEDLPKAPRRRGRRRGARMIVSDSLESHEMFFYRKYLFDRCIGSVLLVLASPVILVLIALIRLTSPGPGLYRQTRVGLRGRRFEIIKLRSMVKNAEKPGQAVWCVKNDCRVTGLGRILRKLHLDELPQLWNVAVGDMSLVGPRPERPEICEKLVTQIDGYYQRTLVKPGVTGLSQINLPPDESIDDVRRKQILDLRYIDEANWWLDIRMLAATGLRMFGIKGEIVMKAMGLCRRNLLHAQFNEHDSEVRYAIDDHTDKKGWQSPAEPEMAYAVATSQACDHVATSIQRPR